MVAEHLERATRALMASLEAEHERLEDWLPHAAACIEAWDHGGATLLSDFPIDTSSIEIVTDAGGTVSVRRKPIAWRPLHEGYGPDHS